MSKLSPCPFCGGEPTLSISDNGGYYEVLCEKCYKAGTMIYKSESEAIEEWNTRVYRTCKMEVVDQWEDRFDGDDWWTYKCSECGEKTTEPTQPMPNYCKNCGAKVIQ